MPTYRDLKRILKKANGQLIRSGKGSHMVWRVNGQNIIVPKHKGKDINNNLYRQLVKQIKELSKEK